MVKRSIVLAWLSLAMPASAQSFNYANLAGASLGDDADMNGAAPARLA